MSFALFGWILPTAAPLQAGTLSQNRSPRAGVMKSSDGKAPTETDTFDDNNISAKYVFGTIQGISAGAEGKFVIEDPRQLTFVHGDSQWQLSYTSITKIEKGDLLERRFGIPYVPKRRRECVTIYFVDSQGRPQRVTFERISRGFRVPLIPRTSALSKWTGSTGSSGFRKSRRILDLFLHGLLGH